jgi:AraC-like DNA-binding protein
MKMPDEPLTRNPIIYTCHHAQYREGEQFIAEHVFGYVIAGSTLVNDGNNSYPFKAGDFMLVQRNHLAKFNKQPDPDGGFKSVSIYLSQDALRNVQTEYNMEAAGVNRYNGVIQLQSAPLLINFITSVLPYLEDTGHADLTILNLKVKEIILLLLKVNPALKTVLFDFSAPGKIDLKAFMQQHYHFKVSMTQFAYLTGRSLATFKRDFVKIFDLSPGRWLQQRRLQEAYFLIRERHRRPSEIYQDLGFQSLAYFSYAFKQQFKVNPSSI